MERTEADYIVRGQLRIRNERLPQLFLLWLNSSDLAAALCFVQGECAQLQC